MATDGVREGAICLASNTDGEKTRREHDGKGKCNSDRKTRAFSMFLLNRGVRFKNISEV